MVHVAFCYSRLSCKSLCRLTVHQQRQQAETTPVQQLYTYKPWIETWSGNSTEQGNLLLTVEGQSGLLCEAPAGAAVQQLLGPVSEGRGGQPKPTINTSNGRSVLIFI
jgi:hypothetical protein